MFADDAQVVAQGVGQVEPEHLGARRHQGVGGLVAHVEDAVDHSLLGFLEGAVLGALLDEVFDLVLGDGVLDVRVDAEQQEDAIGRARQKADEGRARRVSLATMPWYFMSMCSGFCAAFFFGRNSLKSRAMYVTTMMLTSMAIVVACGRKAMKLARNGAMKAPVQMPMRMPVSVMPT